MPTYNDISLELHCSQGAGTGGVIEEFAPRQAGPDDLSGQFMPPVFDHGTRTVSVFIPIFSMQQFWLVYSAKPPKVPQESNHSNRLGKQRSRKGSSTSSPAPSVHNKEQLYVFKLFMANEELVTWSCGPAQNWQGKTVFGMFDTGTTASGKGLQKRIMVFGSQGPRLSGDLGSQRPQDRKIEIRVYRASSSLRVPRQTDTWNGAEVDETMARTENGGITQSGHPKKFFYFGLVDALDQPYATFRYYYRYWEEIHALQLRMGQVSEEFAPELFVGSGDVITKEKERGTIRVEPSRKLNVVLKPSPGSLRFNGRTGGVPAVTTLLLPPNHPHSPTRASPVKKLGIPKPSVYTAVA